MRKKLIEAALASVAIKAAARERATGWHEEKGQSCTSNATRPPRQPGQYSTLSRMAVMITGFSGRSTCRAASSMVLRPVFRTATSTG